MRSSKRGGLRTDSKVHNKHYLSFRSGKRKGAFLERTNKPHKYKLATKSNRSVKKLSTSRRTIFFDFRLKFFFEVENRQTIFLDSLPSHPTCFSNFAKISIFG